MKEIPFDVKYRPQIESGEYKVVDGWGNQIRIICWDAKGDYPIIGLFDIEEGREEADERYAIDGAYKKGATSNNDLRILADIPEDVPQIGDTWKPKGKEAPTIYLCSVNPIGDFAFVENGKMNGIAGGCISTYTLQRDYELVERHKSLEDALAEMFKPLMESIKRIENKPDEFDKALTDFALKVIDNYLSSRPLPVGDLITDEVKNNLLNIARKGYRYVPRKK
jgi:hypothetical protein